MIEETEKGGIFISKGVWQGVLWIFRGLVTFSCITAWSMFNDLRELNTWRTTTLPVQVEAQAQQVETQIMSVEERSRMNAQLIQMLQTEITNMQIQMARIEERSQ